MDFIPKDCHPFYESLCASNEVQDDAEMFGISPDFILENEDEGEDENGDESTIADTSSTVGNSAQLQRELSSSRKTNSSKTTKRVASRRARSREPTAKSASLLRLTRSHDTRKPKVSS
jgi:hypothetical protein